MSTTDSEGERLIDELAELRGIEPGYIGTDGKQHPIERRVKRRVLEVMGVDVSSDAAARASLARERANPERLLEPVTVARIGRAAWLRAGLPARAGESWEELLP